MSNPLWDKLDDFVMSLTEEFNNYLEEYHNEKHIQNFDGWIDTFWHSDNIRKCHLKTINDGRMWLLHINIFPKDGVNLPILGFDIVASKSKISGSFFDFSPVFKDSNHHLSLMFKTATKDLVWNKPRELPEWAQAIFSDDMVAAGSIKEDEELTQLMSISSSLIKVYLMSCNDKRLVTNKSTLPAINKYCKCQKMNKHLHRSILAMGIPEKEKDYYINNILFEEI
jgi:hypothetical protein